MYKYLSLFLLALVAAPAFAGSAGYCRDPAVRADWLAKVAEHRDSDTWQRLHALWLGLCVKVDHGNLGASRAARIFEAERQRAIEEARDKALRHRRREIERRLAPAFDAMG